MDLMGWDGTPGMGTTSSISKQRHIHTQAGPHHGGGLLLEGVHVVDQIFQVLLQLRVARLQRQLRLQPRRHRRQRAGTFVVRGWVGTVGVSRFVCGRRRVTCQVRKGECGHERGARRRPGPVDWLIDLPEPEEEEVGLADDVLDEVHRLQRGALHARHVRVQRLELLERIHDSECGV